MDVRKAGFLECCADVGMLELNGLLGPPGEVWKQRPPMSSLVVKRPGKFQRQHVQVVGCNGFDLHARPVMPWSCVVDQRIKFCEGLDVFRGDDNERGFH